MGQGVRAGMGASAGETKLHKEEFIDPLIGKTENYHSIIFEEEIRICS